jgi:hypothetical protein
MQTPGETFQRLVAALEQLVAEEQCVVRNGEIERISAVQHRAEAVIARLAELRRDPGFETRGTEPLLQRLAALQVRREATVEIMDSRLAEMRASLADLDAARGRLGKMRSSYGSPHRASRQEVSRLNLSA